MRLFPRAVQPTERNLASAGLKSLCGNLVFERFCRARLQAGTVDAGRSSPKGERYRGRRRFAAQTLKSGPPKRYGNSVRDATNLRICYTGGTQGGESEGPRERLRGFEISGERMSPFQI